MADDVTMGGLRPAMSARGLTPTDGSVDGMVAPAALPLAWLAALADAGCERLLVRGLPDQAFPLPDQAFPLPDQMGDQDHK